MDEEGWGIKPEELLVEPDALGCGTFGVVHKAKWRDVDVAVKYFNNKTISNDPSFKRETDILRSLQHSNIIKLFGMGEKGKQHFMVMELAPQSLDYVIHEAKTDFEYDYVNVLHWVYQLAGALDYCHTKKPKVIHRDVKPPNVLLFDRGLLLKVCDFGTAKLVDTATLPDTFIGTPYYLAPEIMEGKHSHKCDIFSFSVTIWEMITRHKPTLNLNATEKLHPYTVFLHIGKGERPPKIVGTPKIMEELIDRCWAQLPDDRPSAEIIVNQLKRVLAHLPQCQPLRKRGEELQSEDHCDYDQAFVEENADQDSETLQDNYPTRAWTGSDYYMHALPDEKQPFVPIPGVPESEQLYEKYCSYMLQTIKAENELQGLLHQQKQLKQQYDSEMKKQSTITDKMMTYKALEEEKTHLENVLKQLKMS